MQTRTKPVTTPSDERFISRSGNRLQYHQKNEIHFWNNLTQGNVREKQINCTNLLWWFIRCSKSSGVNPSIWSGEVGLLSHFSTTGASGCWGWQSTVMNSRQPIWHVNLQWQHWTNWPTPQIRSPQRSHHAGWSGCVDRNSWPTPAQHKSFLKIF